jgi:predicted MFS family arabinose efflux permease
MFVESVGNVGRKNVNTHRPYCVISTLIYTVNTAVTTKAVAEEDSGTAIGLGHSTRSGCGIVGPMLGGLLYTRFSIMGIGYFAALSAAIALFTTALMTSGSEKETKDSKTK